MECIRRQFYQLTDEHDDHAHIDEEEGEGDARGVLVVVDGVVGGLGGDAQQHSHTQVEERGAHRTQLSGTE